MHKCKVRGCRFADTHVTIAHVCGNCKRVGHGRMECGLSPAPYLLRALTDVMPEGSRCGVVGCDAPWTHMTVAHPDRRPAKQCPLCRVVSRVDLDTTVFTDKECVVCCDNVPVVVFPACRHAVVCVACVRRMPELSE